MRIVHVAAGLVRAGAGVREVVAALSSAQERLGHEVTVVGLDHPDWSAERDGWPGAQAVTAPVLGPRSIGYAPAMRGRILAAEPDVVHLHGVWMHPGRSVLQWHQATGRPYVVSVHGMLSEVALGYSPRKKRLAGWLFQDAVFRHAACLHATSDDEEREIRAFGVTNPVARFPNGVHTMERPSALPPEPTRRVLSLGRIHPKKGLDRLLQAWAALEPEFPGWSLDLVGPDEVGEAARLSAMIARLGLARAAIRGPLFGDAKTACMAGAQIFVLPTLSENFALTVAESLMLGVPVVSSKGAPWSGLDAEGCGRWVDHGSEPMAAALRELMRLPASERRWMGERGRAWVLRDFSWDGVARASIEAYEKYSRSGGR